ncbi:MAG: F0F1 ATP synthase subunit B [Chthoniobacterales bacterium]
MLIDWFTVIAQAVNFLILVWLLKRLLYQPILRAIDEREKRIAAQLENASAKEKEAQQEHDEFQRKNEELAAQRETLLKQATEEANAQRLRLLEQARKESESFRAKLQQTLQSERDSLNREITGRTQQEVFAIARRVLSDLAATSLEGRMIEVFLRRLHELNGEEKGKLISFLKTSREPAVVRSACALPVEGRAAIERALHETCATNIPIRFETVPALVSGIELSTSGHKLAWSIADYLESLQKSVGEILDGKHATGH